MFEMEKLTLKKGISHMYRGLKIIRELYPRYLTLSITAAILRAVQPLVIVYFTARILNELAGGRDVEKIITYVAVTVGITFVLTVGQNLLRKTENTIKSTSVPTQIQYRGKKFAAMDFEYVEDSGVSDLLAQIHANENGTQLGIQRLFQYFPELVERFCGLIASTVLLAGMFHTVQQKGEGFLASRWATLLLGLLLLMPLVLRLKLIGSMTEAIMKFFAALPKSNSRTMYYRNYIRAEGAGKDIRIFGQQHVILSILNEHKFQWIKVISRKESESTGLTAAANAVVGGLTYLLVGLRALAGMYTIGAVAQYIGAITLFSNNLTGLITTGSLLWSNAPALPLMYRYLDLPDRMYMGSLTTEKRADNDYEIEFHDVSFRYPGSEQYALKHLNMKLTIGRRLAVVGMNGSGKTTMIKLLCRLYDPTEGVITLNGIDIKKYDYTEYLALFSVVFQDFRLLDLPLGQNVAASAEYDAERVGHTLEVVGFSERAKTLPHGLDTALNKGFEEDGVIISGGEAQKIALARALYKNAPFVILDEPTAALDPIAEYEIYSKFDQMVGSKTAVYISHRLSSCRFCHDIAVFHEGELIQRGSHDELVADETGKYYELWHAQAQYYNESKPATA